MLQELQDFGLSEKEARVYLAGLELGKATADELAKQAKVNRSTTYVQIESLAKKGLMSSYDEGKKTYFAPESPEYLKRLFEKQAGDLASKQKELEKLLPNLSKMFETAGERPRVRFFEGKEGLITMREEFLKTKEKEIIVVYSFDALSGVFNAEERKEYVEKRKKMKIKIKALYTKIEGKIEVEKTEFTESRKIPENIFPINADIVIYGDRMAVMGLKEKLMGVIIESADMANSFRSIFNLAWEGAEGFK